MTPTRSSSRRTSLAALGIVIAVVAAYATSFAGAFVFDDKASIVDNPSIRHLGDLRAILAAPPLTTPAGRPLVNLSLALNYAISGQAIWSYHALNLAIHACAALVLFGIVRRTARRFPVLEAGATSLGFAVALLWALDPVQTESVTYVVQRAESLMGLLYLLAVYGFVRGVERAEEMENGVRTASASARPAADNLRPSLQWFILSVGACWLGAMTKEVIVTAPVLIFLFDRTFFSKSFRAAWAERRGYYLALGSSWLVLGALVLSGGGTRDGGFDIARFSSWWGYWLTQTKAVVQYLRLSFWPYPQVFDYGLVRVGSIGEVAVPAIATLVLVGAVIWALARRPVIGFLGAWFIGILAPSSVMPGTIQMIVEHRLYLSLAAPVTLVALLLWRAWPRVAGRVVVGLACICGVLTAVRNRVYASEESLWTDVVVRRPENARGQYNLGHVLYTEGRTAEAIARYERAIALDPADPAPQNNLGTAYLGMGRFADAATAFQRAIALAPRNPEYAYNLGLAMNGEGRKTEALDQFQRAIDLAPGFFDAWNTKGATLAALGRNSDAIDCYKRALEIAPDAFEPANNLGLALISVGQFDQAIGWLDRACKLQPGSSIARVNLALAHFRAGHRTEAIASLREAVAIDPANTDARAKLDSLLRP